MSAHSTDVAQLLRQLRLNNMAAHFEAVGLQEPALAAELKQLLQIEVDGRRARVQHNAHQQANVPEPSASLEDAWYQAGRNLNKAVLTALSDGSWVKLGQHVLITGATGRGKTWLASALTQTALRMGKTALYYDVPDLLAALQNKTATKGLAKFRQRLERVDLLVLDDWGVDALSDEDVQALRRVVHDRSEQRSIVLVSPYGPEQWRKWIGGYVGDSLMDRIENAAVWIDLKGPSLRRALSSAVLQVAA